MDKITQIVINIKAGNTYSFSYTDKQAEAQYKISIVYDSTSHLFYVTTIDSHISGEMTYTSNYVEEDLAHYLRLNENRLS